MVLNVDLNTPPVPEGTSASVDCWVMESAAVAISTRSTLAESSKGLACSPIDVEAIDDDVELLSSTRAFPQGRNWSRRKRPIVDLEEIEEIPPGLSGLIEKETVDTLLSLNNSRSDGRSSINRTSIDLRRYFDLEGDDEPKRRKINLIRSSDLEHQAALLSPPPPPPPPPVLPREPVFTCPVCMSSLTDPCSTVCGHIFCQLCIEAAIKAKKQCPNCRRKLPSKKSFHRVYLPTSD